MSLPFDASATMNLGHFSEAVGVRSEKACRGFDGWSLERFPFEGIGLTDLLQLPNSYPCIRVQVDRSDNFTYSSA